MSHPTNLPNGVNRFCSAGDFAANDPDGYREHEDAQLQDEQQEGRPAAWDQRPSDAEINAMARHFNVVSADEHDEELVILEGPPAPYRHAEKPNTVTVNQEALDAYQAANDRFWGLIDGVQRELERTQTCGPCAVERLSQLLKRKLEEMDQVAREWSSRKYAV
jgi:hypothetical protein